MTEKEFISKLKSDCSKPVDDTWFVKKTVNRLPEKEHVSKSDKILIVTFGIIAVALILLWPYVLNISLNTNDFAINNIVSLFGMSGLTAYVFAKLGLTIIHT